MEMRFEILRPERLQLEVCISAIDSTLQYSDEFQNLIEKLIASQFPKFFQSISIVVELRITQSLTPPLDHIRYLKLKTQLLIVCPVQITTDPFHLFFRQLPPFNMILQYPFKLSFSKILHEITGYIREMLRLFDQIMHFMKPLTVVIIQMQQKVFCLVHLMYKEVLGHTVPLIGSAQIRLIADFILLKI